LPFRPHVPSNRTHLDDGTFNFGISPVNFGISLGVAIALLGVALYAVLALALGWLHTPWYTPALATAGVCLIALSIARRPAIGRIIAILLIGALAAGEWWFLAVESRLPAYAGPVSVDHSFPQFAPAHQADGTPFTRADLVGPKNTVVVFFRGFW
jgi:hypothetical protein